MAIPKLKKQDIIAALEFIDENGVPEHNTSVKYVLVSESGKKYPPKYVVAVADHLVNGADISTESFNSVDAKNYLESLGFSIETKQQEKFELSITAESVQSTDERFTMDNLNLGDNYKPLDAYFKRANGDVIKRAYSKGERRNSNQTLPRIACQVFEKQLATLSVEDKESFPVCKYSPITTFFGKTFATQGYSYDFAIYKAIKAKKSTISKARAKQEELKKYIFIIDEINRGEISKIFGELFFAIDPGYRGKAGEISTQYSNLHSDPDEKLYIPENVYIIGTMNDIDRSVDSFDFAMRRRFRFVGLKADERLEMLASLENEELEAEAIKRMAALNKAIVDVEDLNENYQIGASYFLKLKTLDFDQLWTDYLQPLLQEYIQGMYDEEGLMNRFAKAYGYQKPARGDANETAQDQG